MFKHIVDAHLFSDTLLSLTAFCRTSGKQIVFPSCTFIDEDSYQSGYYICPHYNMKVKEVFKKKNHCMGSPQICQDHFDLLSDTKICLQLPQ